MPPPVTQTQIQKSRSLATAPTSMLQVPQGIYVPMSSPNKILFE